MAEQAIPAFAIVAFLGEEAPVDGHSAGVSQDGANHADQEQDEEDVEDDKEDDVGCWLELEHVEEDEYDVVEENKNNHSDKVRVDEFPAAYLAVAHEFLYYLYL